MFRHPDDRRPFGALLLTYALDYFAYLLVIPLFPILLFDPEQSVLSAEVTHCTRVLWAGGLLAIFGAAQLVASPVLGAAADRYGCRPVLLWSVGGCALGYLLMAVAVFYRSLPLLILGRLWTGLSSGNAVLVQAGVGGLVEREHRGRAYGYLFGIGAVSLMLGPLVGGALLITWALLLGAAVSCINLVILSVSFRGRTVANLGLADAFKGLGTLVRLPGMVPLLGTFFAFLLGRGGYSLFFSTFLMHRFGLGTGFIGEFYALMGLSYVLTGLFLNPFFLKRFTSRRLALWGALLNGIGALVSAIAPTAWSFLIILPFCALGASMAQANFSALVSQRVPDAYQGRIFGLVGALWSAAQALGPLLAGLVGSLSMTLPLALCGLFYLTSALGAMRLRAAPAALEV